MDYEISSSVQDVVERTWIMKSSARGYEPQLCDTRHLTSQSLRWLICEMEIRKPWLVMVRASEQLRRCPSYLIVVYVVLPGVVYHRGPGLW